MNRTDAENYADLFITKISRKILAALSAAGWTVVIEDYYADFKDYICSRDDGIAGAFTKMNLVIMTPNLEPTDAEGVDIHFLLHADPARFPVDRNAYARDLQKDNYSQLQAACESILRTAEVPDAEPVVAIRKYKKMNLAGEEPLILPYEIEISYWVAEGV